MVSFAGGIPRDAVSVEPKYLGINKSPFFHSRSGKAGFFRGSIALSARYSNRETLCVGLSEAMPMMRDADLLLFRGTSLLSRLIQVVGRGGYSHAAKVVWCRDVPMVAEIREFVGGRLVTLESQVRRYSGQIDLYRTAATISVNEYYDREAATRAMIRKAGKSYNYLGVLWIGLCRLPLLLWLFRRSWCCRLLRGTRFVSDRITGERVMPEFCSQACASADVAGGVDPVPNLRDRVTEPN